MRIAVTHHDTGRAYRECRDRGISMKQALDIHDPFVPRDGQSQLVTASRPCWTWGFKVRFRVAASDAHFRAIDTRDERA